MDVTVFTVYQCYILGTITFLQRVFTHRTLDLLFQLVNYLVNTYFTHKISSFTLTNKIDNWLLQSSAA